MVILLTAFMLQASVDVIAVIVLIVQPVLLDAMAARQAARASTPSAGAGG